MTHSIMPAIELDQEDGLAIITLARPETANNVDRAFAEGFRAAVARCNFDRSVTAVLIRAAGGLFCAGGDVASYAEAGPKLHYLIRDLTEYFHANLIRLAHMRKPVVTAVQGATAGADFALALSGDIVVAGRSATFALNYPALGLSPDAGTTWLLPRLVGVRRAQEMVLLNPKLSADEALAMGLITRVVADAELATTALDVARTLSRGPARALGSARALTIEGLGRSYDEQLAAEASAMIETANHQESRHGVAAMAARRTGVDQAA